LADGLGARFADVQARELAFFRDLAPLAQKSRSSATRLFGVVAPLATTGASIASSEPVSHAGGDNAQRLAFQRVRRGCRSPDAASRPPELR
jgi:hypothetical protein